MIRQQPITNEETFMDALEEAVDNEETLFIQWHPDYWIKNLNWPVVELLENFLEIHTNPNDTWYYIESGRARAWKLFPSQEERDMLWSPIQSILKE